MDIGLERSDKVLFGRAYLFGKSEEEKLKKAFFFSIEDDVTPEGLERYYKLHPFIKENKLSTPCEFSEINGLTTKTSQNVLICPDAIKISPFELGKMKNVTNAKRYVKSLSLHNEKNNIVNNKKVRTELDSCFDNSDELQRLLNSLSLKNINEVHANKSVILKKSKKLIGPEHLINDVKLTPDREITLDQINSVLLKGTRKFMKFDNRADIHQCEYSSDGDIKARNSGVNDDFGVYEINERIRQRRQLQSITKC